MKCQKCRQPLKLHGSLEDLNPASFNLLIGSTPSTPTDPLPTTPLYPPSRHDLYEKAVSPSSSMLRPRVSKSVYTNPAESFVVLTESQVTLPSGHPSAAPAPEPTEPASTLQRAENLFEILSARTDIDHPICRECSELLIDSYTRRLHAATKERDAFTSLVRTLPDDIPDATALAASTKELARLESEESAALAELAAVEAEKSSVDAEIRALEAEAAELALEEEAFWKGRNAFALKLQEFTMERDSVNSQYDHDARQLERLQRTNVYNDTFCIGHDGYFGTINGLRLGRLPSQPVDWSEINAAWGLTLLLLATIADKLHFSFVGYRLKPMGSTSRIEKLDPTAPDAKPQTLELFSSGDLPIGRMFMHRRFDSAMVAFLECLKQLGDWVEERSEGEMKLPYKIVKDRIGDSCIRLAFNQDEGWTRACKYTLTCVKFLLAHTSNTAYLKRNGNA